MGVHDVYESLDTLISRWKTAHLLDYFLVEQAQIRSVQRALTIHEQDQLDTLVDELTWEKVVTVTNHAAEQVFGVIARAPPRPWLAGRNVEMKALSYAVYTAKLAAAAAANLQPGSRSAEEIADLKGVREGQPGLVEAPENPSLDAEAWQQHFQAIQNGAMPVHDRVWNAIPEHEQVATWMGDAPSEAETRRAIQNMKCGKAPGVDGVTVEALRWGPESLQSQLHLVVTHMWNEAGSCLDDQLGPTWPTDWSTAIIIPLWKQKQPKTDKNNWRGITLLSVGAKIVARIVANRLQRHTETFMDEHQQGFRRNRGVDDVLQVTRRVAEEVVFSGPSQPVTLTLYDIEKAYPRVNREALWELLRRWGSCPRFIKVCQALHNSTLFRVQSGAALSRGYYADRGLKEGCPSSPPLFNVYHAAVMKDYRVRRTREASRQGLTPGVTWKAHVGGQFQTTGQVVTAQRNTATVVLGDIEFADDTATLATADEHQTADRLLEETFTDWGEKINRAKTESLISTLARRQKSAVGMPQTCQPSVT
ncbi:unnamed protein product [Effrenium voratum]|uniref:Reverse transcriptase domain-containing protein n=1 Tax=Effrenium voratum TaxID=2562239 RepID=A0AA36MZR2_9DINO|nr:unnamed protein product [Effrenium voratum]